MARHLRPSVRDEHARPLRRGPSPTRSSGHRARRRSVAWPDDDGGFQKVFGAGTEIPEAERAWRRTGEPGEEVVGDFNDAVIMAMQSLPTALREIKQEVRRAADLATDALATAASLGWTAPADRRGIDPPPGGASRASRGGPRGRRPGHRGPRRHAPGHGRAPLAHRACSATSCTRPSGRIAEGMDAGEPGGRPGLLGGGPRGPRPGRPPGGPARGGQAARQTPRGAGAPASGAGCDRARPDASARRERLPKRRRRPRADRRVPPLRARSSPAATPRRSRCGRSEGLGLGSAGSHPPRSWRPARCWCAP